MREKGIVILIVLLIPLVFVVLRSRNEEPAPTPEILPAEQASVTDPIAVEPNPIQPASGNLQESEAGPSSPAAAVEGVKQKAVSSTAASVGTSPDRGAGPQPSGNLPVGAEAPQEAVAPPVATAAAPALQQGEESTGETSPAKHQPTETWFHAPEGLPLQSPARPFGIPALAPVRASDDDPAYREFVETTLPELDVFLDETFRERATIEEKAVDIDLEDLHMAEDASVRIYFIKEGTIFHNSLGIIRDGEESLIFPDASSIRSYFKDADTRRDATSEDVPLLPGDYVDLGVMKEGEPLDLFLIQDGARQEDGAVFYTDRESNPGKRSHVKLHGIHNDSTLIIGFEDIPGGGDKDYNDLVIAVEFTPPK